MRKPPFSTSRRRSSGLDLSRIKVGGKEYQVIAQLERASRLTPQNLDAVFVRSAKGELIQLSTVGKRDTGATANAINHYGRLRSASITASPGVRAGYSCALAADVCS